MSLEGGDVELEPLETHAVADVGRPAEQRENQAADAVDLLVLQLEIEQAANFIDPHRPRYPEAALPVTVHRRRPRGAFVDVADDLLEQILERHDARRAAVLVDDDDHLRAL